ncbi:fructose-specific phosphotransferase system IIA component [Halanaerobium saccharolyticum]|jgi:fructose-specific phosphotransferase system IIA component|uniref:Fructose-specific phosphotransferase system IIA component n=1 Tax=Halanaerobium saccharolyticum TaxID=43595 RepID=A0A2T5RJS2_9FIRM|nr:MULTISPECIES: PTS sugar transporter subunit IIA [Halanaerobium]KXS48858.1 MAG: putative PTS IIA-like nitrogen-regulatory protein PtsN [Halanaerobium sp. T82-1]PTV98923.1 fructose-specific phosphotransferase system IIA component [Halanaerobium saccharolyticum]PUU89439.1 MAG: putative PTS IIA-like nitrogen-regulatory protein PtsN [Halanaerobium sp.]PUU93030.1 MAG: putative PTS IIA-like nitrogen-regulatory protein PtsN [Halanaerobium sp.]TDP89021.1 fructose-specific phosphotransferase system I
MKISKLLEKNLINLDLNTSDKEETLREMVNLLKIGDKIQVQNKFLAKIIEREKEGSTGFGREIAVPHGKSETVNELSLAIGRSKPGIEYHSLDGKKVKLIFMVADYPDYSPKYLKLVSTLVSWLREDDFRKSLLEAEGKTEFIELFKEKERSTE